MHAPRTLTARLVATAVVLVALVCGLIAVATTVVMDRYLVSQRDEQVHGALQRAANPRRNGPDAPPSRNTQGGPVDSPFGQGPGTIVALIPATGEGTGVLLTDSGGYRQLSSHSLEQLTKVADDDHGHDVSLTVGHYRAMATRDSAGNQLVVGLPTKDIRDTTVSLLLLSLLLGLAAVGLTVLAAWALIRRQLRPLRDVAATAHDVTRQQLSTGKPDITSRVEQRYTDPATEVGQVGHALNTLLDHMGQALAERHRSELQVRQFVADASHELRTPLATIHGYAELSRRTPNDAAALSNALDKVETEAGRMSGLVEDLLLLARLDAGRPLERGEVDVTRLLLEAVADARVLSPEQHWRLSLPEEPIMVPGDEQRLHQAVTNLLGNARSHTPPGTTVTVGAAAADGRVRVTVHDDGPGLAAELVPHAFDRFARGDTSRTRASGGAGLGLSLVAAIAAAHGGRAEVLSAPGDTTFSLLLPR